MMSTIAGEETSSDGSEVTMTAPESERTGAETTGTTGQWANGSPVSQTLSLHHLCVCWDVLVLVFLTYAFRVIVTREWDRGGRERRSRGEYRDYDRGRRERFTPPRHDMSPQQKRMRRDWWDERQWLCSVFPAAVRCRWRSLMRPCQGWSWWRSLPRRIWLGLQRRRGPQLRPPAALGPPWPASHAASSWHPHTSKVRGGVVSLDRHLSALFFLSYILKYPSLQAWQHPWHGFRSTSSHNEEL